MDSGKPLPPQQPGIVLGAGETLQLPAEHICKQQHKARLQMIVSCANHAKSLSVTGSLMLLQQVTCCCATSVGLAWSQLWIRAGVQNRSHGPTKLRCKTIQVWVTSLHVGRIQTHCLSHQHMAVHFGHVFGQDMALWVMGRTIAGAMCHC